MLSSSGWASRSGASDTGIRAVSSEIRTWSASRILTTSYTSVPCGSCRALAVVPSAGTIRADTTWAPGRKP
jgi:hypothetical protein